MKKLLSIAIVISLCFTGCGKNGKPVSRSTILFDTSITITIYDGNEEDLDSAFSLCRKYEQLFSRTIPDSEISRLNGGDISVIPSEETMDILKTAGDYSLMSKGAFDVTICSVSSLWNFKEMPFKKPTDEMIKNSLKSVDYHNVLVENGKVTLKNNAKIDLGAIAKGYAADKVAQLLINRGIQSAIINFGGNVLLIGEKQNGGDFKVGITKPFSENHGEISATVETTNRSVVTSGIYERYYKDETSFYHHILDPKTGYPVENDINSVTIIGKKSAAADALSTACYVLGRVDGMNLINSLADTECVYLLKNGEIIVSDGLTVTSDKIPVIKLKN